MGTIVQGLRHVFEKNKHSHKWAIDDKTSEARERLFKGNNNMDMKRKTRPVHLF